MSVDSAKTKDMGSAHSGVGHFLHQRISAVLLAPLTIWFAICALGLVGANLPSVDSFFQQPMNALLMGAFILLALYHMALGLQEVIADYIPHEGFKIFLVLVCWVFALIVAAGCVYALLTILI